MSIYVRLLSVARVSSASTAMPPTAAATAATATASPAHAPASKPPTAVADACGQHEEERHVSSFSGQQQPLYHRIVCPVIHPSINLCLYVCMSVSPASPRLYVAPRRTSSPATRSLPSASRTRPSTRPPPWPPIPPAR